MNVELLRELDENVYPRYRMGCRGCEIDGSLPLSAFSGEKIWMYRKKVVSLRRDYI